jgi:predicted dehydrogenase
VTKLGWGILGAGRIAKTFVRDCQVAGLNIAAVGSRSLDNAQSFSAELGIAKAHDSYQELVDDPNVDAVYVATPQPFHAANALLAIEAGKHVLVEKPFTLNATQAKSIKDAAAARGVFAMEAMWTRFLPSMLRIEQIVADGVIGVVRAIQADHSQFLPYERAPRLHEPSLGGGALLDLGIYPVSFVHRLLGEPSEIVARGTLTDQGVDEIVSVIMTFESGAQASIQSGFMAAGSNTATVIGSHGRIEIDRVWYNQASFTVFDQLGSAIERYETKIETRGMQFQALEVERCVAAGLSQSERMSLDESIQIMSVLDEIRRQIGVSYPGE